MKVTMVLILLLLSPMLLAGEKEVRNYRDQLDRVDLLLNRVQDRIKGVEATYKHQAKAADGSCPYPRDVFAKHYPENEFRRDFTEINDALARIANIANTLSEEEKAAFKTQRENITGLLARVHLAPTGLGSAQLSCGHEEKSRSSEALEAKSNPSVQRQITRDAEAGH